MRPQGFRMSVDLERTLRKKGRWIMRSLLLFLTEKWINTTLLDLIAIVPKEEGLLL